MSLIIHDDVSQAEGRRRIDESVDGLKSQIAALYSQRNFLSPICRIPPEILSEIFLFAKGPTYCGDAYAHDPFGWIQLTHVCGYLRNAALASPNLWANGPWPLDEPEFLDEMLSRSKDARLVVKVNFTNDADPDCIEAFKVILEHSKRIKHLAILIHLSQWEELENEFPLSTPQLEHLSLACARWLNEERVEYLVLEDTFSNAFKLRHLALDNFNIDWNLPSALGQGLTYLKLHDLSNQLPTWEEFTDALNEVPNLEVLDIQKAFPVHEDEEVFSILNLASLQLLIIGKCTPKEVESFLSYITFPSTTKIKIKRCSASPFSRLRDELPGFLERLVRSVSNASFQSFIFVHKCDGVQFRLFDDVLQDNEMFNKDMDAHLDLDLSKGQKSGGVIPRPSDMKNVADIATAVFDSGIGELIQSVHRVCLAYQWECSMPDILTNTIGRLGEVRHIMANQSAHKLLADFLQHNAAVSSSVESLGEKMMHLPKLSSLCLLGMDCKVIPPRAGYTQPDILSVKSLYDCLVSRRNAGANIDKLTLKLCSNFNQDDLDLLERVVPDVDWDEERVPFHLPDEHFSDYVELLDAN